MTRVMLVDDHRLVRAGLRRVLQSAIDIQVVAEASSGEDAIRMVGEMPVDVVLMDINMPGIGGLEATRRIVQRHPQIRVIVVTMHTEEPYPSRMIAAGAIGYLSKDSAADEVIRAIHAAIGGAHYVAQDVAKNVAENVLCGVASASPFELLSQRETQVMLMVTKGYSTQDISDRLNLSPKTVSTYRYRLFEKLNVTNNVELTRMAMRFGLLPSTDGTTPAVTDAE